MTILFAASEMDPLARTGGLADVARALPAALAARGHEVSVVLPAYRGLTEQARFTGVKLPVGVGPKQHEAEVWEQTVEGGVQVFLIRCDEYFDRPGLYGPEGGSFEDNAERFIFFSRAILELSRRILPPPQIVHCHDWQTALVPVLVKERRLPFKTVFTIHNAAYQGSFWAYDFGLTRLPGHYFGAEGVEFYGRLNLMKGALLYADALTTVSERYAREIRTPEFGFGLDAVLREQSHKLTGILNGADYRVWDPAHDPHLPARYTAADPAGKLVCREALLKEFGLQPHPEGPVFALTARLAAQKGIELLLPLLDRLLADDVRLIVLGEGDLNLQRELLTASRRHAGRFAYRRHEGERNSHLIEAGSDVSLIPSYYEPCGLSALYGLRYGALPLAHATGGLFEIVQDYDASSEAGNGFLFFQPTVEAFWDAIVRARRLFAKPARWAQLRARAMGQDFSWERAVGRYEALYEQVRRG